jgi:hypothetical protein
MTPWITRRFVVLAVTHLGAALVGLAVSGVMVQRQSREASSPWIELGAAWTRATNDHVCAADMGPWARSVVAHRASLAADDFAVEAAVALHLLGDGGVAVLAEQDRLALRGTAERCPAVLHAQCDGERFDRAVRQRCGPPKRHHRERDGGNAHPDAGAGGD